MKSAFAAALMLSLAATAPALACEMHETAAIDGASMSTAQNAGTIDPMMTAAGGTHDHGEMDMMVPPVSAGGLVIEGYWVRAMLPGQPVAGGFLTITNNGSSDDRIISASSPAAGRLELHEMAMEGDVMKMREIAGGIVIKAGETVELKPGGLHLMFFDVPMAFVEGNEVPVTLTFEQTGQIELKLPVIKKMGAGH
jgi:periplasmic copper chaperone A